MSLYNAVLTTVMLVSGIMLFCVAIIGSFNFVGYFFYFGIGSIVMLALSLYLLTTEPDQVED
jgi:bacteriorhodopsin